MSKADQYVFFVFILLIVIHLAIGIAGIITGRFLFLLTVLNLAAGLSIIIYWLQKQLRIQQHIFEQREFVVLNLELIAIGCAIAFFLTNRYAVFFKAVQYSFFTIHLLILIAGLVFMLTFKMNKLI